MKIELLLIVLFLFTISVIAAQNHMDIMTTMIGEYNFAYMGWIMTTLDWNGDGFDDLVVDENSWKPPEYQNNPSIRSYGKLFFYFGGPNFDNQPEFLMPGHHQWEYAQTSSMCNAGDMNHDGYDDLALFRATMYENNFDQFYDLQLCVFNGGANPDTIPDYVLTFPREEYDNGWGIVRGLGDINHDGFDDLGYIVFGNNHTDPYSFRILYGGSQNNFVNTVFQEAGLQEGVPDITGLGDINADGIVDFSIGYLTDSDNWIQRVVLFYGHESGVYSDSVVISDEDMSYSQAYPIGDINWDGVADFVSHFGNGHYRLYQGSSNFDSSVYTLMEPNYIGDVSGWGFGHGDVNGDGAPDLMGTNFTQANGYGDAYLWMGGTPINGGTDLHIIPPDLPWPAMIDYEMFGFCLTMGDYNGDGCCDAAISAPFDYAHFPEPGHVFVYAGNRQLNDPTPIADDTAPVISKMQLYPNPLHPSQSNLIVKFTPLPPSSRGVNESSTFEIYNIKGQKVKSYLLSAEQTKSGSVNYSLNDLTTGVYICTLTNGNLRLKEKITIVR